MLADGMSVEFWLGIAVAFEAKKFVAVEGDDEITAFVGLNGLDCFADDLSFALEVGATVEFQGDVNAVLLSFLQGGLRSLAGRPVVEDMN